LQESGRTGAFGKVHLNPHFGGLYPDYHRYGFDVTHITEDTRGGEWLDWVESEHPQHYQAVLATIWPIEIPEYAAYSGSYNAIWSINPGDWTQTILTNQYRYTIYPQQGGQLFDLQKKPDEQLNLVADTNYLGIRQKLQYQLMELIILQDYPKTRRELFALVVH